MIWSRLRAPLAAPAAPPTRSASKASAPTSTTRRGESAPGIATAAPFERETEASAEPWRAPSYRSSKIDGATVPTTFAGRVVAVEAGRRVPPGFCRSVCRCAPSLRATARAADSGACAECRCAAGRRGKILARSRVGRGARASAARALPLAAASAIDASLAVTTGVSSGAVGAAGAGSGTGAGSDAGGAAPIGGSGAGSGVGGAGAGGAAGAGGGMGAARGGSSDNGLTYVSSAPTRTPR